MKRRGVVAIETRKRGFQIKHNTTTHPTNPTSPSQRNGGEEDVDDANHHREEGGGGKGHPGGHRRFEVRDLSLYCGGSTQAQVHTYILWGVYMAMVLATMHVSYVSHGVQGHPAHGGQAFDDDAWDVRDPQPDPGGASTAAKETKGLYEVQTIHDVQGNCSQNRVARDAIDVVNRYCS